MKKNFVSLLAAFMLTLAISLSAQNKLSVSPNGTFSVSDIEYWVGEGDNEVAFIVMYGNSNFEYDNLVFGYRWNGSPKSFEAVLKDIVEKDSKFEYKIEKEYGWETFKDFRIDLDNDGVYEYVYGSTASMISTYSNGIYIDLSGNLSGGEWISMEKNYSSNAANVEYFAIPGGVESCTKIKDISFNNITISSATINWEDEASVNNYLVYWKADNDATFSSAQTTQSNYDLTGLNYNTVYSCYVVKICSEDDTAKASKPQSFRTKCISLTQEDLPYIENFDNYDGSLPYCWNFVTEAGYPQMSGDKHSGSKSLCISTPQNVAVYSICQGLDAEIDLNNIKIKFYSKYTGQNFVDATFKIGLASDENATDFQELLTVTPTSNWKLYEMRFDNYQFDNTKRYITVQAKNNGDRKIFIDDFSIEEIPACEYPIITNTDIADDAKTTISFTKGHATDNSWVAYYQKVGVEEEYDSLLVSQSPFTLNLDMSSFYNIWLKTLCNENNLSEKFETITIQTPCDKIHVLPFKEDWESFDNDAFPLCWTKSSIGDAKVATYNVYNGAKELSLMKTNSGSYVYVTLPALSEDIILTDLRLSFYGKGYGGDKTLYVGVMTSPETANTFTEVKTLTLTADKWELYEVDFAQYTGTGKYIALKLVDNKLSYSTAYIDDIKLNYVPSCDKPKDIAITENSDDASAIDINFDGGKGNEQWYVYYKTPQEDDYIKEIIAKNPYTLTGLQEKETYSIYMTTVCGNEESAASEIITYQTPCYFDAITEFPYKEDFEQDAFRCLNQETSDKNYKWNEADSITVTLLSYSNAAQGKKYGRLFCPSVESKKAKLILPVMDLTNVSNPMLSFYLINAKHTGQDYLSVLYRTSKESDWKTLKVFNDNLTEWTIENIALPEASATYQIAFDGTTKSGKGIGLDSIVVGSFVCDNPTIEIVDSLCEGETYVFRGESYTNNGIYNITAVGPYDCDTAITLTLSYKQPLDSIMNINLCQGDSIAINGTYYKVEGEYDIVLAGQETCDTNLHLTINTIYPSDTTIIVTLNEGDQILVAGEYFSTQGNFTKVIPNVVGCDSTITINITVNPSVNPNQNNSISKDDASIVAWAAGVEVHRDTLTIDGEYYDAVGKTQNTKYVSLGNGGYATATFDRPIQDGTGNDFVVFSHGTEINTAFVEVSSDGVHFFRFNNTYTAPQTTTSLTYNNYTNLAGVYNTGYGVAFDINGLADTSLLNKFNIRFVRVIDVQSSIDKDFQDNIIYDDATTNFLFAGIGVINGGIEYNIANMDSILTQPNTYEIVGPTTPNTYTNGGEFFKDYVSEDMVMQGRTLYGGYFAMGWGPSNLTSVSGNSYYASSALAGMDGKGDGYMNAYYSEWNDGKGQSSTIDEHCIVTNKNGKTFYPQGVYVSHSDASYGYKGATNDNQPGWHKVIVKGLDTVGNVVATSSVYLTKNNTHYKDWLWLDMSSFGEVKTLKFTLESNYANQQGMLIPAYFCMDNLVYTTKSRDFVEIKQTLCAGESFMGKSESGTYLINDTLLTLTIKEAIITDTTITVLSNELPYTYQDITFTGDADTTKIFTAADGCDSTVNVHFRVESGLDDMDMENIYIVYPNPTYFNATLFIKEAHTTAQLIITDQQSRVVYKNILPQGQSRMDILSKDFASGVYYIRIIFDDKVITKKLIKR